MRRKFIALLGGAAAGGARAAERAHVAHRRAYGRHRMAMLAGTIFVLMLAGSAAEGRPRIAFLGLRGPQQIAQLTAAFIDGLHRLGYTDGRDVDIDYRNAAGNVERLKPLAQELIALKPDILVTTSPSSARVAKTLAPTLPIVCLALTDAVIPDLIASYGRPGGNVTGMAQSVEGLTGKLVEVALEIAPGAVRIGFLSNSAGASMRFFAESVDAAARTRGIAVLTEEVEIPSELALAFDRFRRQGVQAVIVPVNGLFFSESAKIAQLALAARLPMIGADRQYIEAGSLASYGIDQRETFRRGASYVDRILKGTKPADLPVEFPTRIELTINLRTAKALGLDLPPTLITRADEVIE